MFVSHYISAAAAAAAAPTIHGSLINSIRKQNVLKQLKHDT